MPKVENLNLYQVPTDGVKPEPCYDRSTVTGDTAVYFRDLKRRLINHIGKADVVVGCVAWLTDFDIIAALSQKDTSIIVQKEDFLRPDIYKRNAWKSSLREAYASISCSHERYAFVGTIISNLSVCGDPSLPGVRCVGNHNSEKKPAFPRMHNKFLVFAKYLPTEQPEEDESYFTYYNDIHPYSVWTGSFNFTKNAGASLENAIVISNSHIADAYYQEYAFITGLSEPLDWETDWCSPEWRIGT